MAADKFLIWHGYCQSCRRTYLNPMSVFFGKSGGVSLRRELT